MAHELTHIKNRDILISTISATMAGAISALAQFGALFGGGHNAQGERNVSPIVAILIMIVAPFAAMLIQMAISRAREFDADAGGAAISGDPEALAMALKKIEAYAHGIPMATADAHPETAQMMIINPLTAEGVQGLFRTHPATEERVARLMAMRSVGGQGGWR
jgi:heat shock protein HtpX